MATTNFEAWLNNQDIEEAHELEDLVDSIDTVSSMNIYTTISTPSGDGWIVKPNNGSEDLILASLKAKTTFYEALELKYCKGQDLSYWIKANRGK